MIGLEQQCEEVPVEVPSTKPTAQRHYYKDIAGMLCAYFPFSDEFSLVSPKAVHFYFKELQSYKTRPDIEWRLVYLKLQLADCSAH